MRTVWLGPRWEHKNLLGSSSLDNLEKLMERRKAEMLSGQIFRKHIQRYVLNRVQQFWRGSRQTPQASLANVPITSHKIHLRPWCFTSQGKVEVSEDWLNTSAAVGDLARQTSALFPLFGTSISVRRGKDTSLVNKNENIKIDSALNQYTMVLKFLWFHTCNRS